ncbi:MAG: glycosyltransferase family 4 protein [Oscillospiraceae bacterium]|nr:glycosyltransferase family 4 protein [Oscillospiraceae bacterium]
MKNILFATLVDINSLDESGIYQDLLREITLLGHRVYVVSPYERRQNKQTVFLPSRTGGILKVRVGNIQKTGKLEKGISTVRLERQYLKAVKKYFADIKFDTVMYSTPPITLGKLISYIRHRDGAESYLLLKDIFPQNAVDLGMLAKKTYLYRYFRKKETRLYEMSDFIGCMSKANVDYLVKHNRQLDPSKVHICPNSISIRPQENAAKCDEIRDQYGIPREKKVFVYGGNLGKPQSVAFITQCLKLNQNKDDRYFLICGEGTDAELITEYIEEEAPTNVMFIQALPKKEYDELLCACDVGLIFLDHRFTIPNFPSRLLSYMQQGLPVLACTDAHSDVGFTVISGEFGYWCMSGNAKYFSQAVDEILSMDDAAFEEMGRRSRAYLEQNYSASYWAAKIAEKL